MQTRLAEECIEEINTRHEYGFHVFGVSPASRSFGGEFWGAAHISGAKAKVSGIDKIIGLFCKI